MSFLLTCKCGKELTVQEQTCYRTSCEDCFSNEMIKHSKSKLKKEKICHIETINNKAIEIN